MKKLRMLLGAVLALGLIAGLSSYVSSVEEGLAGYWSMDEGKGSVVKDRNGNGNDDKNL
jgi:hypothetical protein